MSRTSYAPQTAPAVAAARPVSGNGCGTAWSPVADRGSLTNLVSMNHITEFATKRPARHLGEPPT
jgi:hypothetical protein